MKTAGKYSVHKCLWNKETLTLLITFSVHICAFQGNVVLTDFEYTILSLLRTRTDTEDVRFAVREKYPVHSARQREPMMNQERYSAIRLVANSTNFPFALFSLIFIEALSSFIKQLYTEVTNLTLVHKLFLS